MFCKLLGLGLGALALASCNTANTHIGDEDAGLGEAVKYNAALQTINPAPVYTLAEAKPGDNGEHAANAVKRYRNDEVKDRHKAEANAGIAGALSTTRGSSGGGSSPH
jgi:hypothetical protein